MNSKKIENIKEYVNTHLSEGILYACKVSVVHARQGKIGEIIETYSDNLKETTNVVKSDAITNQPGWVLCQDGKENYWIVNDSYFKENYTHIKDDLYLPKSEPRKFLKLKESISFTAPWGEEEHIKEGGYLNITDMDNIYGIQESDFKNTYQIIEK